MGCCLAIGSEDMVLLALESEIPKKKKLDPPFTLVLQRNVLGPVWKTDVSLCVELAQTSDQWSVAVCKLEDVTNLRQFLISSEEVFDKNDLILLSRQIKEQQLAVRAAALARGREKKKRQQARGPRRPDPKKAPNITGDEESSDNAGPLDWQLFEAGSENSEESDADMFFENASPQVPAESGGNAVAAGLNQNPAAVESATSLVPPAPPSEASRARTFVGKRKRTLQWGPFQIAQTYSHGWVHTGWGAVCGLHADKEGGKAQCKAAIRLKPEEGIDNAVCILRLKRWLLAGKNDESWPQHCLRTHHASLGGPNLETFAEGQTEEEMDREVDGS